MKKHRLLTIGAVWCIAALVLFSASAFADTVVGTSAGGWQTSPWSTDQLGIPYWNGDSSDNASAYNIGNYLTNSGGFSGGSGPGVAYSYWGTANGGSDRFGMKWISGTNAAAMMLEVAGYASRNTFGYFDGVDLNGDLGYHPLFLGGAAPGATVTFAPTMDYVFYLESPDGRFKTDMSNNEEYQHFAIFKEAEGVYWIGMEDLRSNSDMDYNDMIVKVSHVPVPEPATMLLVGLGLVGLAGIGRRFKK